MREFSFVASPFLGGLTCVSVVLEKQSNPLFIGCAALVGAAAGLAACWICSFFIPEIFARATGVRLEKTGPLSKVQNAVVILILVCWFASFFASAIVGAVTGSFILRFTGSLETKLHLVMMVP